MKKHSEADMRDLFRYDRDVEPLEQPEEPIKLTRRGSEHFHRLLEEIGKLHDQLLEKISLLNKIVDSK